MPGNKPCPPDCPCEKHSRPKDHIRDLGRNRQPCPDGCTCGRHNREKRREAASARWSNATPEERAAQAQVCRDVANAQADERSADFVGWIARVHGDLEADEFHAEKAVGLDEHRAIAEKLGIKIVQAATLRKYGLTELEWLEQLAIQGWRCPICLRRVQQFVTDHEHVKDWKTKPPDERKRYFRGVLCVYDNYKVVPSRMSAEEAARMARYIRTYEHRRDAECAET